MNYIHNTLKAITHYIDSMTYDNPTGNNDLFKKILGELETLNIKMNEMENELSFLRAKEAEEEFDEDLQEYLDRDQKENEATGN